MCARLRQSVPCGEWDFLAVSAGVADRSSAVCPDRSTSGMLTDAELIDRGAVCVSCAPAKGTSIGKLANNIRVDSSRTSA